MHMRQITSAARRTLAYKQELEDSVDAWRNTKRTSELEMAAPVVTAPRNQPDVLESAGRLVDEHMQADGKQLELSAQLKIATHSEIASLVEELVHVEQSWSVLQPGESVVVVYSS